MTKMKTSIWKSKRWQHYYDTDVTRSGLRVYFEKDVHGDVKRACKDMIKWLRSQYVFPKRVRLYVKASKRIKSMYGDMVCGTFFRPIDREVEPYIRIATGDYLDLVSECGEADALAAIIWTILHELTHYYQWLNDIELTPIGEERQATQYANRMLYEYAQTRDTP